MGTNIGESNFYKLLDVSKNASEEEIRKSYRNQARRWHPDKHGGSDELMKRLVMAKDTLLDPDLRQKYDHEYAEENIGGPRDVTGFIHNGKRLSFRFKRNLAIYEAEFHKLDIQNNYNDINHIMCDMNNRLVYLINSSNIIQKHSNLTFNQDCDPVILQQYFYNGQYKMMALYLVETNCHSSLICDLHEYLTTGRDVSCTRPSYQAGLLLLKGQISANELKHRDSLDAFQQAIFMCPNDEVISAVNLLLGKSHFIELILILDKQLFKGSFESVRKHLYKDRLKRSNHLGLIYKYENGLFKDQKSTKFDIAMMYIDLSMAASGVAMIHCFVLAIIYLLEEINDNDKNPSECHIGRVYAICKIISEMSMKVLVLSQRQTLPITELHFNKLIFIYLRKAYNVLEKKLCENNISLEKKAWLPKLNWRKIFGRKTRAIPMFSELNIELYKMMANTIYRLAKVCPLVDLPLTTVTDLIYLDLISDEFVEEFYQSKIAQIKTGKMDPWTHLYKYHLLECAWKTGDMNKFEAYREEAMNGLLEQKGWCMKDMENIMSWNVINRDDKGWIDINRPWLNLQSKNYDSVNGLVIDFEEGTFRILCTPSLAGQAGLFDTADILEVLYNGITYSVFTLDPPDCDYHYHPFNEQKYSPSSLENTNFLQTLLHADYLLKMISMGTEVSALIPYSFRDAWEYGFLNILPVDLRNKVRPLSQRRGGNRKESQHRFWIESGELEYSVDEEDNKLQYKFGSCPLYVKTHLMKLNTEGELVDVSDDEENSDDDLYEGYDESVKVNKPKRKRISAETEFANDFTEAYDKVGYYYPVLLRLREMIKLNSIYIILKSIYMKLETAKVGLKSTLEKQIKAFLKIKKTRISYPQNNSSNVNKIYQNLVNGRELSYENNRALKREIEKHLKEIDVKIVTKIAEDMVSELKISYSYEFPDKIRDWLTDSWYKSNTQVLVDFIVNKIYPIEFEKLDRFSKNAAMNGICFDDRNEVEIEKSCFESTTLDGECTWVPAAFCKDNTHRIYGGVFLKPQLKCVINLKESGSNTFAKGSGPRDANNSRTNNKENVHGNSSKSSRAQHMYEIRKNNPGGNLYNDYKRDSQQNPYIVYKYGISSRTYKTNRDGKPDRKGLSVRGGTQTELLNKDYVEKKVNEARAKNVSEVEITHLKSYFNQNPVYTNHIETTIDESPGARTSIKNAERNMIDTKVREKGTVFGKNVLPGNREPATIKLKKQLFN